VGSFVSLQNVDMHRDVKTDPNTHDVEHYRGVTVCERWRTFDNFLADLGERPEGTSLGRFADVGNYEPGNCAWQTKKEQASEQKIKRQLLFLEK